MTETPREYRCQSCGWWMFTATATRGRVATVCRNRACPDRQQTVSLAGPDGDPGALLAQVDCANARCRRFLFATDATAGWVQTACRDRRCGCVQTVRLGPGDANRQRGLDKRAMRPAHSR